MSEDRMKNPEAEAEAAAEGKTEETAAETPSPDPVSNPAADENGADSATDSPAEVPAETTEETTPDETAVLRDRLLRLQADFDNYRKRMARDRQEFVTQANADVLEAMLPPMKRFLAAGGTKAPADLARIAGFDISTDGPLNATIDYIGLLIDEICRLTEEIDGIRL